MIMKIEDTVIFHSKQILIHELTNGVYIMCTVDEDSANLNHEEITNAIGSDENIYRPAYDSNSEMIGYRKVV